MLLTGVRARVHLLATEKGGRKTAITRTYHSSVHFLANSQMNDAVLTIEDGSTLSPGKEGIAQLRFLAPELVQSLLVPSATFELKEGGRTVGGGTILEPLSDETMQSALERRK